MFVIYIFAYLFLLVTLASNAAFFLASGWQSYKEFFWEMNGTLFWAFFVLGVSFGFPMIFPVHSAFGMGVYVLAITLFLVFAVLGYANYMTYGSVLGK